jgi:hypothetical protein
MISIDLLDNAVETDLQKIVDPLGKETRWPEIVVFDHTNGYHFDHENEPTFSCEMN